MFLSVITIAALAYYYNSKNRMLREFKKTRKKNLNSIKRNEYAKVIGKAQSIKTPLIAPLSKRLCVYYHIIVEVKTDKNWHKIIDDAKSQDFIISTQTEIAIVKPSPLNKNFQRVHLVKDFNKTANYRNNASAHLEAYLKSHNKKSRGFLGTRKNIRYREGIIEIDENIAIKGIAHWETLHTPLKDYSYSKILTLTGTKKQKLLITDEPKALLSIKNI